MNTGRSQRWLISFECDERIENARVCNEGRELKGWLRRTVSSNEWFCYWYSNYKITSDFCSSMTWISGDGAFGISLCWMA